MLRSIPIDVAFLDGVVAQDALAFAMDESVRGGGLAHEILIHRGVIGRPEYLARLAAAVGARYDDLTTASLPSAWIAAAIDGRIARAGCARLILGGREHPVVAPQGEMVLRLLATHRRSGAPMAELVITAPARLSAFCLAARPDESVDHALRLLARAAPGASLAGFGVPARLGAAGLAIAVALIGWLMPAAGLALIAIGGSLLFLAAAALRIEGLAIAGAAAPDPAPPAPPDTDYTILVPLRGEAAVVRQLFAALDALIWPVERKQVILLIEDGDAETRRAIAAADPTERFTTLVLPPGGPRTKPRALQFGLLAARGRYLTIYDAEDEPEPDQLIKAAARFEAAPRALACLQARLSIHNAGRNWRTRQFALEYAALFEVLLPGLAAGRHPIPLGGTSNHFRVEALRAVGGWDPWNVTEDAELGIRLACSGYQVATLASRTEEEAPVGLAAWFGQRSRWYKGWLATLAVLASRPIGTARALGASGLIAVAGLMGASLVAALFYPVAFVVPVLALATAGPGSAFDAVVFGVGIAAFVGGHAYSVLTVMAGAQVAGLAMRPRDFATLPVYWLLCSVAAWRAVVEFVLDPSGWSKTGHVGRAAGQPASIRRSAAAAREAPWPVSKVDTNRPAESSR